MNRATPGFDSLAADLRRAFDESFARLPKNGAAETIDLLGVGVGGRAFALAIADVAAILEPTKIVRVPSARPALLGLAGVRGNLVAVYGLGVLFGGNGKASARRWIAVSRADETIAFAFDEVTGLLRVPASDIVAAPAGGMPYVSRIVRDGGSSLGILDAGAVVAALSSTSTDKPALADQLKG